MGIIHGGNWNSWGILFCFGCVLFFQQNLGLLLVEGKKTVRKVFSTQFKTFIFVVVFLPYHPKQSTWITLLTTNSVISLLFFYFYFCILWVWLCVCVCLILFDLFPQNNQMKNWKLFLKWKILRRTLEDIYWTLNLQLVIINNISI